VETDEREQQRARPPLNLENHADSAEFAGSKEATMRRLLTLALVGLAIAAVTSKANASHIQSITPSIAEAFCAKHGGGTSCDFCNSTACHVIGCDSHGKNCKNAVLNARPNQGGIRRPIKTINDPVVAAGPVHRPVHDLPVAKPVFQSGGATAAMHHGGRH
jgi:hypothetical protein